MIDQWKDKLAVITGADRTTIYPLAQQVAARYRVPKVYADQYRKVFFRAYVRSLVKPGITGLAQARGFRGDARTPEEVVARMQSDIEYLENWSFWKDCWLILRTALQVVIPPKTAI